MVPFPRADLGERESAHHGDWCRAVARRAVTELTAIIDFRSATPAVRGATLGQPTSVSESSSDLAKRKASGNGDRPWLGIARRDADLAVRIPSPAVSRARGGERAAVGKTGADRRESEIPRDPDELPAPPSSGADP